MNGIKVSVIIPVYNAEKYIEKCLDSILGQNFQDFEVILVNDGSTDRSLEICKTVSNKNKCISVLDQENQGVSIARQKGINSARGQFIAFIDADDYVKRDYLEVLYKNAIEYDVDIVCCDCTELYEDGTRGDFCCVKNSRLIKKKEQYFEDFLSYNELYLTVVWGKIIKAELAKKHVFEKLKFHEDILFMMDIFSESPRTKLITYKGYYYVRQKNSTTMSTNVQVFKREMDYLYMCKKVYHLSKGMDEKLIHSLKDRYVEELCRVVCGAARINQFTYKEKLFEYIHEINEDVEGIEKKQRLLLNLYLVSPRIIKWWMKFKSISKKVLNIDK